METQETKERASHQTLQRKSAAAKAHIATRCEGAPDALKLKKRHVKPVTRLPTKNVWQLLCWAFIVAKSTPPKAAPMLDFASLHCANTEIRTQDIHKCLWTDCG
jgi:hypothetical protein